MGILSRLGNILGANVNALLDKAEDPSKMIDQYLHQATRDLEEVKKETASIVAEESRTRRIYDENIEEVVKYTELAKKALMTGSEEDAKIFLHKKQEIEKVSVTLKLSYDTAKTNATKMRQLYDKLVDDISTLHHRRELIKFKISMAKAQEKASEIGSSANNTRSAMSNFNCMEERINKMVDIADAKAQLNAMHIDDVTVLEKKYRLDDGGIDNELEALKKTMGLSEK